MIICCGEALIDMIPGGNADAVPNFVPCAGGSVFNAAVALGRLGAPTAYLGGVSTDFFGGLLRETLEGSDVSTSLIIESDRPTTLAFVRMADGKTEYAFFDENTAGRMLYPADVPELPAEACALFFGSISLISEPCGSFFEALATREAGRLAVMYDPNVRPGFVRDERAYRSRIERFFRLSDIVKLSDEDLSWLEGGSGRDEARSVLSKGPSLVVVTRGAEGATAHARGAEVSVPAKPVAVADTVGAGDSFSAGILAGLHAKGLLRKDLLGNVPKDDLVSVLELGAAVSAVTSTRVGANPPFRRELPDGAFG